MGPRDPVPNVGGSFVTPAQQYHLDAVNAAGETLYNAMHAAEGTTPPGTNEEHRYQSRRMAIAATNLETCLMYARKAVMEVP